ncbi:MAG: putative polyhydroxyalkanoate system protein [Janthinobacterium sp.]
MKRWFSANDLLFEVAICVTIFVAQSATNWHDGALVNLHHQKERLMDAITIVQEHALSPEKAREAAQIVADRIAEEYALTCAWDGDVLRFERSGVEGALTLEKKQAHMHIKLGFLFSVFSSKIEHKVAESMQKVFGSKA